MEKKLLVKKSNQLILSNYNLTLIEHRFLNMCLGRIYHTEEITPETKCKVYLKRYAKEYGVKEKVALDQFKTVKKSLIKKTITDLSGIKSISIVEKIEFETNQEIYVQFNGKFIKHISSLKANFTKYELGQVVGFKKVHTFRIYEICKSVAYTNGKWEYMVEVEKLKLMLSLDGKCKQYGSFKRIIKDCIEEINSQTNITVSLEESLLFKKVAKLVFKVTEKQKIETEEKALIVDD